jgi:ligand-binding sensor domain-containing protein
MQCKVDEVFLSCFSVESSTSTQLPENEVNAFSIDAQGNKCLATENGVSKVD